jgi:SAM-dependent methyltransferase
VESFNGINNVYEDQALYAKITLNAPVIGVDTCWDLYRQHPGSSVAVVKNSRQDIKTRLFFLSWLSSYLSAQEIKDPKILIALRKELWKLRHPKAWQLWHKIQQSIWKLKSLPFWLAERILPAPLYHWLKARWRGEEYIPPTGRVRFGNFRRLSPFSRTFGYNRGQPIDRYYIEQFLALHQMDVRGRVLEIADRGYTCQFGGDRVTKSDILHVTPGDPKATIIGDLASADHIPSDSFDCIILTQTLQFIFDIRMALQTIYRILKPGGVILATFPGITAISRYDMDRWGQFWGFSSLSARRLFEQVFAQETLEIKTCGNILTASAFLYGMAAEELREDELEYFDPDYEVIIAVRATKPKPEEQTQI